MIHPDPLKEYQLHTDASDRAVGAILTQEVNGVDRPVQYISKAAMASYYEGGLRNHLCPEEAATLFAGS